MGGSETSGPSRLTDKTEVLTLSVIDTHEGVTFSSTGYLASTVVIDFVRWVDMGQPGKIVVTITPAK